VYQTSEHLSQPLIFRARRGHVLAVRQTLPTDTVLLAELLSRLSERTLHLRYMRSGHFSADAIRNEAMRMTRGDPADHTTLVATRRAGAYDEVVAVGELARERHRPSVGELALVVRDDQQRQGLGSFLLTLLVGVARQNGIATLSANMLAENKVMLRLIRGLGLPYKATTSYGEMQVSISLPEHRAQLARGSHMLAA
jgi:acetyltransferase